MGGGGDGGVGGAGGVGGDEKTGIMCEDEKEKKEVKLTTRYKKKNDGLINTERKLE